ncbi:MAG: hypothetical protein HYV63_12635 [Candidatus Schekmanbacteria bacterium]|nr:hypothetical protein [Candidatus Schekmanbacteria bacterium]
MARTLIIKTLSRERGDGGHESLTFSKGVNLIVGPPNSGKSAWLKMLDYLFGDPDPPQDAFTSELAEKYVAVSADMQIGDKALTLQRRWDQQGFRSKILVNGDAISVDDLSDLILNHLDMPNLHFPKGNPYSERTWPRLSWRILMRHIYRRERFWADIADRQPESEQHAALVMFLGLARQLFPPEWNQVIQARKDLTKLQAKREQFEEVADHISREVIPSNLPMAQLNPISLLERIRIIEQQISQNLSARERMLTRLAETESLSTTPQALELSTQRAQTISSLIKVRANWERANARSEEINDLYTTVQSELERLERAMVAGQMLADLKITHCPACDQEINSQHAPEGVCFLCHQHLPSTRASDRLEFELEQLRKEQAELGQLRESLRAELVTLAREEKALQERVEQIDGDLRPLQSKFSALFNTQLGVIDSTRGALQEQLRLLGRIKTLLAYRDQLDRDIDAAASKVAQLESLVNDLMASVRFTSTSSDIEDSMHHFFDALNQGISKYGISSSFRWSGSRVSLDLKERGFLFRISGRKWSSQLGATAVVHFLLAYHYALLCLTPDEARRYPGFLILDFPAELLDAKTIGDKENYLIEPFVNLCKDTTTPLQVIIAGRSFQEIEDCRRIEFNHVWR